MVSTLFVPEEGNADPFDGDGKQHGGEEYEDKSDAAIDAFADQAKGSSLCTVG